MKTLAKIILKFIISIIILFLGIIGGSTFVLLFSLILEVKWLCLLPACFIILPIIIIVWIHTKKALKICGILALILISISVLSTTISIGHRKYEESITVNTSPNIDLNKYLPFKENSEIVKLENASLKLTDNLPIIDGAAAVFPVYSAFVHAVYPETTNLNDGVFEYNNTSKGYELLANKETDIFFGAYPSKEQIEFAKENNVEFEYTPIGNEAFVFFVNIDNPIDNLTTEQIKAIYAGEITNWKEVGGKDEKIIAYQRNVNSGSQSMLIRFMDGKEIMEPPTNQVTDLMSGIIDVVADYKTTSASFGFSFRYYVEGIIANPKIKIVSVDGIKPTVENIKNGKYPITTLLYAVTYKGNDNENVYKLIDWVLSDEGQKIIEDTGYVGIK